MSHSIEWPSLTFPPINLWNAPKIMRRKMEEKEIKKLVEYLIDTQDFFLERNKETGYDEVEAEPLEDLIYHFFLSR